jgi:hypothetical protein
MGFPRKHRFAKAPFAVVTVLILVSGTATAKSRVPSLFPPIASFDLRGTNGYEVTIFGAVKGSESKLTLQASRGKLSTSYTVPATITPTRINASFGRLGHVSLRFLSAHTEQVKLPRSCRVKGAPPVATAERGTFLGTIAFHGERNYTSISTPHVNGGVGETPALYGAGGEVFCSFTNTNSPGPKQVTLDAAADRRALTFSAIAEPIASASTWSGPGIATCPGSCGVTFLAFLSEERRRMSIGRSAIALGPDSSFAFDSALSSATLIPPAPFSGSATFQRSADTTAWTGSLRVSFPGRGPTYLTGPQFETSLKRR